MLPSSLVTCLSCCGLVVILKSKLREEINIHIVRCKTKKQKKKKHIVQNLLAVSERIYSPTKIHNPATCAIVHLLHGVLHCSWLYCVLNCLDFKTGIWIFHYLFVWYCLSVSLYLLLFSFYVPSSPVLFLSSCPSHPSIPPPSELSEIHTHRLPTRERERASHFDTEWFEVECLSTSCCPRQSCKPLIVESRFLSSRH